MQQANDILDALAIAKEAGEKLNLGLGVSQNDEDSARIAFDQARQNRIYAEANLKDCQFLEKSTSDQLGAACIRRREWQLKIAGFTSQMSKMQELAQELKSAAARE